MKPRTPHESDFIPHLVGWLAVKGTKGEKSKYDAKQQAIIIEREREIEQAQAEASKKTQNILIISLAAIVLIILLILLI